jgi:hypothetical protein
MTRLGEVQIGGDADDEQRPREREAVKRLGLA